MLPQAPCFSRAESRPDRGSAAAGPGPAAPADRQYRHARRNRPIQNHLSLMIPHHAAAGGRECCQVALPGSSAAGATRRPLDSGAISDGPAPAAVRVGGFRQNEREPISPPAVAEPRPAPRLNLRRRHQPIAIEHHPAGRPDTSQERDSHAAGDAWLRSPQRNRRPGQRRLIGGACALLQPHRAEPRKAPTPLVGMPLLTQPLQAERTALQASPAPIPPAADPEAGALPREQPVRGAQSGTLSGLPA